MNQKFNESFSEYLARWRGKLSLMKHQPAESNQLTIVMEGWVSETSKSCTSLESKKNLTWPKIRNSSVTDHQIEEKGLDPVVLLDQAITFKSMLSKYPEDFPI